MFSAESSQKTDLQLGGNHRKNFSLIRCAISSSCLSDSESDRLHRLPLRARINKGRPACGFLPAHTALCCVFSVKVTAVVAPAYILSLVEQLGLCNRKVYCLETQTYQKVKAELHCSFLIATLTFLGRSLLLCIHCSRQKLHYLWHEMEALQKYPRAMRLLNRPLLSTTKNLASLFIQLYF